VGVVLKELLTLTLVGLLQEPYLEPQSLAGNILAMRSSPFVVFYQPALLGESNAVEAMGTEPFSVSGLLLMRGALSWENWGFGLSHVRSDIYKESELCVGKAMVIPRTRLGISLAGSQIRMGTDEFYFYSIVFGTLTEFRWLEVSLRTRISGIKSRSFKPMPTVLGVSTSIGENPIFYVDIEQEAGFDLEWHISMLWKPIDLLGIGTGISSQPPQWTLGIATQTIPTIHYTIRVHTVLGLTHSISVGWIYRDIEGF